MIYDIIVFKNLCFRPSTRKRKAGVFKAKISTLESVFETIRFQWLFSPDTCGRWAKPGGDIRFQTKSDTCGRVGPNTVKFRKWSPGLMFFEGPFWGAYIRRGLCKEGNLRFKIDWPSLLLGRKFTVFLCYTLYLRAISKHKSRGGGLYLEGRFNERFWG